MSIVYVGEYTIGGALPGASAAAVAGVAGINGALPDILARLASLAAFAPQPVSFAAQLLLAEQMMASVTQGIALGIPEPSIAAQLAAIAALVAELLATVAAVNGQLSILADFQGLLAAAGLHLFAFDGTVQNFGGELATELAYGVPGGSPVDHCNAIVMLTSVGACWSALSQVVQVTP